MGHWTPTGVEPKDYDDNDDDDDDDYIHLESLDNWLSFTRSPKLITITMKTADPPSTI